jgi:hypothetical protein
MTLRSRSVSASLLGLLLAAAVLWCGPAAAQSSGSSSFSLDHQTLNVTGGVSSSASFTLTSCLTHDPAGSASSASFQITVGCVAAALTSDLDDDDDDGDGVSNAEEDGAPNGGDGNDDGTADRLQSHVASFAGAAGYLTVIVDPADGCDQLLALDSMPEGALEADPGFRYPLGYVSFTVECTSAGADAPVDVLFHGGSLWPPIGYRNYGPQAPDFGGPAGFYDLPGAIFDTVIVPGDGITPRASFTLTDGQLGDHEAADATISTLGGPAFAASEFGIPTLGAAGAVVFAVLLGLVAVLVLMRLRAGGS